MARTSKTMLNKSGESEHPCLVPDLRGNEFVIYDLYYVEVSPFCAHFMEDFIINELNFVKSFSVSNEIII